MNFSLLYLLFLQTLVTSNDRLRYLICHYHVLVRCFHRYRISNALAIIVVHVVTGISSSFRSAFIIIVLTFRALRSLLLLDVSFIAETTITLTIPIPSLSLVRRVNALDLHSRSRARLGTPREDQILAK